MGHIVDPFLKGFLSPYITYLFSFYLHLLLWPLLIYPHPNTTFVFFGYLFVYLNLVSVYFTHWKITFCLPPSVIFHFYFTRLYQNVFCFTSLAPRSIFVYLAFFLVPRDLFLFTWLFVLVLFDYPIIWRTYFLCTSPLSKWYHLILYEHSV